MASGCFNCNTSLILYPSLFLILFLTYITYYLHTYASPSSCYSSSTSAPSVFHGNPWKDFKNQSRKNNANISHFMSIEKGLARSRSAIREAARKRSYGSFQDGDFLPTGSVYRNPFAFHQSHKEMEKHFRIWVYKEGEAPIFHHGPMSDIYSIEGQFLDELQSGKSPFSAKDPNKANAFFIPVSVVNIVQYVYKPYTNYSRARLQNIVKDYIDLVSQRYPYWNKSRGADHFLLSCHDWAPDVSTAHPSVYKNMIRALCNANSAEGFKPQRDVSVPEIKLRYAQLNPLTLTNRTILGFFAGGAHGPVRAQLFHHWEHKNDRNPSPQVPPQSPKLLLLNGPKQVLFMP